MGTLTDTQVLPVPDEDLAKITFFPNLKEDIRLNVSQRVTPLFLLARLRRCWLTSRHTSESFSREGIRFFFLASVPGRPDQLVPCAGGREGILHPFPSF